MNNYKKLDIETAINRISWRFKNEKIKVNESKIIINEKDIEAVDFLIDWINRQKQQELMENILFAKIFTYAFTNEIIYLNGNAQEALQHLQNIAKQPIQTHYDKFHKFLNVFECNKYLESLNIENDKHPALRTDEETKEIGYKLKNNEKEFLEKVNGTWSIDQVYKSLNNTITEFINRYKNF